MRVLFDMVHPANVLFFLGAIQNLKTRGDEFLILSRHKDVLCNLLDQFDLPHTPISTAGNGKAQLGKELLIRDWRLWKQAREFKPHVMIGFGGVAISHVGKVTRIPSISFYDTDTATLQNKISQPFISHLYIPECYAGPTPKGRTTRFRGIKEMSYFHPDNFSVDDTLALNNGYDPTRKNFFIRTVKWRANHDMGKSGWSDELLRELIEKLSAQGRVHLSSERELPNDLAKHLYAGAKNAVHHLIAKCDLYVGESATMGQEAAMLGTPAIYDGADYPAVTMELVNAGLLGAPYQAGRDVLFSHIDRLLNEGRGPTIKRRDAYTSVRPNVSKLVLEAIDRHAKK